MATINSGKDVIWAEQSGSATHINHSAAVSGTPLLAASGTTNVTVTQPSPPFAAGEHVNLRDSTKTAKCLITAVSGTSGSVTVTLQPYFSSADSGSPSGATFTSATLESVVATPTRAVTLTIDLRDAPAGQTYSYLIVGIGNIGQSAAVNVSNTWLRAQATAADPYAGTTNIGLIQTTHTGSATHNFLTARRESLATGAQYVYQLEIGSATSGGTATMQYGAILALRHTSATAPASTNGDSAEVTSTSSTFATAKTLGSNALTAGTYLIVATAAAGSSTTGDDTQLCLVTDAASSVKIAEGRFVFDAATDYYPFSYVGVKTLTGTNEIKLLLARTGATATAKAKNIQLCAIPLPAWLAGVSSSDFTGSTINVTTASTFVTTLQQSGSITLSAGSHIEIVSGGVTAVNAATFGPLWAESRSASLGIFGNRYQGSASTATKFYATSWLSRGTRTAGATTNTLTATTSVSNTATYVRSPQFFWIRESEWPDPGLESKPASAALGNTNFLRTATIASKTSEATNYPARYLLSDHRTRRWRSTSSATAQQVVFDLGSARLPTMLALIDYNGTTGTITLESSSNSSFSANLQTYSFATLAQSANAKTICFYPAVDNWNQPPVARQFWRLTLPANATADAYHELGGVWLGTYEPFDYVSGLSVDVKDDSPVAESRSGARYVDQFRPSASLSFSVEYLSLASAQSLRDRLLGLRQDPVIVDVHAVSTASGLYPYGRFYGYLDPSGISADLQGGNNNTVSLSFVESRG